MVHAQQELDHPHLWNRDHDRGLRCCRWNQAQKYSEGVFSHANQNNLLWSLYYTVDTAGGDSGSAIEQNGFAVAAEYFWAKAVCFIIIEARMKEMFFVQHVSKSGPAAAKRAVRGVGGGKGRRRGSEKGCRKGGRGG